MNKKVIEELNDIFQGKVKFNEQMSKHTSFKIGGPAEIFIQVATIEEIQRVLEISNKNNIPLHIIGNGSNLLVSDKGIKGIVLKISIKELEIEDKEEVKIKVGAGVKNAELGQKLLKESITGFEFAYGIPGTIGGAIYMNAGAYGGEFSDIVEEVTYIDELGKIHKITNKECEFEYRNSIFTTKDFIILNATLKLKKGNFEEIENKMKELSNSRKEKQPIEYPSAGSSFKRGDGFITAKLIDECGLRGYKIGGAQISTKHAGFIVNLGNATANDVLELVEYTKKQVFERYGKIIELEFKVI